MTVDEEALTIGVPPRVLEARLARPATTVRGGAVVCHPHPQYGGDMDNGVVRAVARALVEAGYVALRFNFGGVGQSGGTYSGGPGEVDDAGQALRAVRARCAGDAPLVLVGYSFGAWVALQTRYPLAGMVAVAPPLGLLEWGFLDELAGPVTVVVGDRDQFCPQDRLAAVARSHPGIAVRMLPGADHFFAGRTAEVAESVLTSVTSTS